MLMILTVFVRDQRDVELLGSSLKLYERASSAKVNWEKSEALQVGQWADRETPKLPGNLSWRRQGFKILGVFLGNRGVSEEELGGCYGESVC